MNAHSAGDALHALPIDSTTTTTTTTISSWTAHACAIGFAFIFVGSLYVSNRTRLSFENDPKKIAVAENRERERLANERWRDDPDVIRARFAAIGIACVVCCSIVGWLIWSISEPKSLWDLLHLTAKHLGFTLGDSLLPHLITPVLYTGPLVAMVLGEEMPFQRYFSWSLEWDKFTSLVGIRSYSFGPLTEEVVFRACVLSVYHLSGTMDSKLVFLTPLVFGIAHLHHAWDTYNRYGRTPAAARQAFFATSFQLLYTTLFGFHAAYLLLRTGSLLPAWTAHCWCNVMGFPAIGYELRRCGKQWEKIVIVVAYLVGVAGYIYTLPRWTASPTSIFWPVLSSQS